MITAKPLKGQTMTVTASEKPFKLSSGGIYYALLTRLKIQGQDDLSIRRRIIILTTLSWLPLLALTALEGSLVNHHLDMSFFQDIKTHVRTLLVLPLFIIAETIIDPLVASNLQSISASGLIRDEHQDVYQNAIEQFGQRKDSTLADIVLLLIPVIVVTGFVLSLDDPGTSFLFKDWVVTQSESGIHLTWAGWWFVLVSTPVLLILLFRWLWRFYLWGEFLFRVSRIPLRLQATHPDLAGGLGILKNGESSFLIIFFAFGAMLSTSLAEEIMYSDLTLVGALPMIVSYIVIATVIMTIPLMFFMMLLIHAKRYGRVVYGSLGYRLSQAFDRKWGDPADESRGDELLKTADASAVCDYSDIYDAVREMRYLPTTTRNLIMQAAVLALPFTPLVFTEYPLSEVFKLLLNALI